MQLIRTVSVFGLSLSDVREQLAEFQQRFGRLKLGFQTKFPEVRLTIYAEKSDAEKLEESAAIEWVCRKLGQHVLSESGQPMERVVGMLLRAQKATLALAESCTGGLVASLLTDVPGSSDYFLFSAVTYANAAKARILDVKAETLERYGAVSEQTAGEMALGAKNAVEATYGLATSGIAGPEGGTADKPVGTVCIGLATPHSVTGQRFKFDHNNRKRNKQIFAAAALDMLRKELIRSGSA